MFSGFIHLLTAAAILACPLYCFPADCCAGCSGPAVSTAGDDAPSQACAEPCCRKICDNAGKSEEPKPSPNPAPPQPQPRTCTCICGGAIVSKSELDVRSAGDLGFLPVGGCLTPAILPVAALAENAPHVQVADLPVPDAGRALRCALCSLLC